MKFGLVIIGGGPAGTGILFKAIKDGSILELLRKGVAIIESSSGLVGGTLVDYKIGSDSLSGVFLECLEGLAPRFLDMDALSKAICSVEAYCGRPIPLEGLRDYLSALGEQLQNLVAGYPGCRVFTGVRCEKIVCTNTGGYQVFADGLPECILAEKVIVATGGRPVKSSFYKMGSASFMLDEYADKCISSDAILKGQLPDVAVAPNKVVVLGGGPSGFAATNVLLGAPAFDFEPGSIRIYSRSRPKLFFNSAEEACQHHYLDFTPADVCPVTKRLFRLAGLRMGSRRLFMEIAGMIEGASERRVIFCSEHHGLRKDLEEAGLIIYALGYTFNSIPIYDRHHQLIPLRGMETGRWVNLRFELLDSDGKELPHLYGFGMGTGFIPSGELGGEPSFRGHFSGFWYYQNAMADVILKELLS